MENFKSDVGLSMMNLLLFIYTVLRGCCAALEVDNGLAQSVTVRQVGPSC